MTGGQDTPTPGPPDSELPLGSVSGDEKGGSLTSRTLRNFLWMSGGNGAEAVFKILVLTILARLLLPGEFGFVSAALTVVALAEVTGRIGVAPALIQMQELRREHIATGLVATLASGFIVAATVYAIAQPIARLYRMPELVPFVQVFSLLFIIKGAGLVGEALMQRAMRFRELAIIQLSSYLFGYALVAVTMASLGFGAWALVAGQLSQLTIQSASFLILTRRDLTVGFQWPVFRGLFRFGLGVTLTQIGGYLSQNGDYFIVGRWLGAEALGFYSRAYLLLNQPAQLVGRAGDQVLFPALSQVQDDRRRVERALNNALSLVAMTQVPLTVLLLVCAPEIIHLLMGPQWGPAVLPFQILVGVLFFRTAYKLVGAMLRATGKVYYMVLWQWSYAGMVLAGALLGQKVGIWGVAIGVSIAVMFCHLFALLLSWKVVGVSSLSSLRRLLSYTGLALVAAIALIASRAGLAAIGLPGTPSLLLLVAGFTASYAWLFFSRPRLFGAEGDILRDRILKALHRKRGRS